jgi:hypothetical protein
LQLLGLLIDLGYTRIQPFQRLQTAKPCFHFFQSTLDLLIGGGGGGLGGRGFAHLLGTGGHHFHHVCLSSHIIDHHRPSSNIIEHQQGRQEA